jgi:hypothetical protein
LKSSVFENNFVKKNCNLITFVLMAVLSKIIV